MKEEIQELVGAGRLEEALALLAKYSSDGILLKGQYASAKRENNMGLLDSDDWRRSVARITHSVLELARYVEAPEPFHNGSTLSYEPAIYIAYNQNDFAQATKIERYLIQHGIRNIKYLQGMSAGEDIGRLMANKTRNTNFFLPIFSANSLREGWEGLQDHLVAFCNTLIQSNTIPLALDFSFAAPNFIEQEINRIDTELDDFDMQMLTPRLTQQLSNHSKIKETNLIGLRNNLPKIVQRLRNSKAIGIGGENFEAGMGKTIETIHSLVEYHRAAFL